MSANKPFRVRFYVSQYHEITVLAASEHKAIDKVSRHWFREELIGSTDIVEPLICEELDEFNDPSAEEV
jgi:hypothetical protein